MLPYIPFIHKMPKKEKFVPMQLPIYIERSPLLGEQKEKEDKKELIIIELL